MAEYTIDEIIDYLSPSTVDAFGLPPTQKCRAVLKDVIEHLTTLDALQRASRLAINAEYVRENFAGMHECEDRRRQFADELDDLAIMDAFKSALGFEDIDAAVADAMGRLGYDYDQED